MKKNKVVISIFILIIYSYVNALTFYIPIRNENRQIFKHSYITSVGNFGIWRKPYGNLKGHYHTGIDFKNPGSHIGEIEPIFACAEGKVISVYNHNASSTIIIKHILKNKTVYSVYTHVADIVVSPGDTVDHLSVIASFIDKPKLDKWGEFLNHLHFEILQIPPKYVGKINNKNVYMSYSVNCTSKEELYKYFYNPEIFFKH